MPRRSPEERLQALQEREQQLKLEKQKIKSEISQKARKERTKRLIEIGAGVESVYGKPITKERLQLLIKFLKEQDERGNFFSNALEVKKDED